MAAKGRGRRPAGRERLVRRLFEPVDIASLVYFRIAFGALMLWEVYRYCGSGWIARHYIEPRFLFPYPGFGWLHPWPGDGMYLHFLALGVLAVFIAAGFLYRLSALLFWLGFSYVFLLDEGQYLNHFYLVSLVAFLMIFVPAHRKLSVDAWLRPRIRSETAPAWALWLLRGQMAIVYFYAGIAKLNGDWLRGWPMRLWLPGSVELPYVSELLEQAWLAVAMSWAGMLFDLLVAPALLWRRTRALAFAAVLSFHLTNFVIFQIGIFPWFAIAITALFFPPDWPRRLLGRARRGEAAAPARIGRRERLTAALVAAYLAAQILIPLRHWLYPSRVAWSEEGHRFSWRMKLRSKSSISGFFLTDPATGRTWEADARGLLTRRQYHKMSSRPYMIHQLAHYLAELAREEHPNVQVRAAVLASLNGRKPQALVDPTVDLAAQPLRWLAPSPWILPLEVPLGTEWRNSASEREGGFLPKDWTPAGRP